VAILGAMLRWGGPTAGNSRSGADAVLDCRSASADREGVSQTRPRPSRKSRYDESGLSIIEVVIAVSVLAVALVLTLGPTISSFATLQDAKVIDLADAIAEGRLEDARQLDFADVGVTGASPSGVFADNELITLQGIEFEVRTTIEWVGSSATGSGLFAGGEDGVQGFEDFGRNYKWLEVWVQPTNRTIDPIIFNTAIAPSFVPSGSDSTGAVTVQLQKFEPVGTETTDLDWPNLVLVTEVGGGQQTPASGAGTASQLFDPLTPDPTGAPYRVRLGPTLANVEGFGWRIHPDDLRSFADQIFVNPGHAETVSVTIYKPVTLAVTVEGQTTVGGIYEPVDRASLILGTGGSYGVFDDDDMITPGTWLIDSFEGSPLVPGTYTIQIDSPGFAPYGVQVIDVPSNYPTVLSQSELIQLAISPTNTAQITFAVAGPDGQSVRGALVNIEGPGYGPLVQTTDFEGQAIFNLPVGSTPTVTVQSPHGHREWSQTLSPLTGIATVAAGMVTPSAHGLIEFVSGQFGYFEYLPFGSGANWSEPVLPNSGGNASAALPANGLGNQWQVRKVCWSDNQVVAEGTVTVTPDGSSVLWGAAVSACLP